MNAEKQILDLILPFYKPHDGWCQRVCENVRQIVPSLKERGFRLHLILVNDGSPEPCFTEDELALVREAADGCFDFISYTPNQGKGESLRRGVSASAGVFQVYTDGDFPFGAESVLQALDLLTAGNDVVMGVRGSCYAQALCGIRRKISVMVRKMNRLILGLPEKYSDTQAGFKAFNARGRAAFLATRVKTFVFDTEFILIAWKRKLKIETLPLSIREGLVFSKMGKHILFRELRCFIRILIRVRILGQAD